MRALVFDGGELAVRDHPDPEPALDEALLRVSLAGVCNTDLEIARGYMGFRGVLGHEVLARVDEGPDEWRGARVAVEINFACGRCASCLAGLGRHCPARRVMGIQGADGGFAEQLRAPVGNLHRVPDAVPDEVAVFCEPLAAAFEILEQVAVEPGWRCVVMGDGKLGTLVAQVLAGTGARVKSVGRHADALAWLATRDIETVLDSDWSPESEAADLVVEATGSAAGLALALRATRPRGTLVLKSTVAERAQIELAPLVIDEIHLIGSRCGPFAPALSALERGTVDVSALVSARYDLADGVAAFEKAATRGVRKVLIDCR